jgi:hypothetical protein
MAVGLACLVCLVVPVSVALSETRLSPAESEFRANDCTAAMSDAERSLSWVASRPEAYQVLGFCDMRRRFSAEAVQAMEKARSYDPRKWETDTTLAVAEAAAGGDPLPDLHRAIARNPLDTTLRAMRTALKGSPRSSWPARARGLLDQLMNNNTLTISS